MSQKHFDYQNHINALEGLNADLQTENDVLKQKIADLSFEVTLLKDICNLEDTNETEALIEDLRQNIRDKHMEILSLELAVSDKDAEIEALKAVILEKDANIAEKDAELENLNFTFNAATTRVDPDALLDTFNVSEPNSPVTEENPNEKMGEDVGEDSIAARAKRRRLTNAEMNLFVNDETHDVEDESDEDFVDKPKKQPTGRPRTGQKGHGPRRILPDGTITTAHPDARPYNSRRIPVTNPQVLSVLNEIYAERGTFEHNHGIGHDFKGVRYAQYFGRLDKDGTFGRLWTIVLSSEGKVYQLNNKEKHVEILWQNDETKTKPAFGTIRLIGEGENYMCSILPVFKSELKVIFKPEKPESIH